MIHGGNQIETENFWIYSWVPAIPISTSLGGMKVLQHDMRGLLGSYPYPQYIPSLLNRWNHHTFSGNTEGAVLDLGVGVHETEHARMIEKSLRLVTIELGTICI